MNRKSEIGPTGLAIYFDRKALSPLLPKCDVKFEFFLDALLLLLLSCLLFGLQNIFSIPFYVLIWLFNGISFCVFSRPSNMNSELNS